MSRGPVNLAEYRRALENLKRIAREHPGLVGKVDVKANSAEWERQLSMASELETNDAQLVVRLPSSMVVQIDAHAETMRCALPGVTVSRADAVRVLIASGLATLPRPARKRK